MRRRKQRITSDFRLKIESLENRHMLMAMPIISEFMAKNDNTLEDGDGRSSDWIEIHNAGDAAIDLLGFHLSDDASQPNKWSFPSVVLEPGGYLVVFASGKPTNDYVDAGGSLHTNFALSSNGEYLGFSSPNGDRLTEFGSLQDDYPDQKTGISYGISQPNEGEAMIGFMATPTPGERNVANVFAGFVGDTKFSIDRGYFDEPILVEINSSTPDAIIHYTTDGSAPSVAHGDRYVDAISIQTTTTLRAMAFRQDLLSTNVDTQTYIFLDDVLTQTGEGLPETWGEFPFGSTEAPRGSSVPANYEMDSEVVNDERYRDTIKDDLQSLPTVSLVMDPNDLWDDEQGIYANPTLRGVDWERAGSIELFHPDGTTEFQVDAGVRIQGGFGRRPSATAKHSFRLLFKGEYGPTRFDYPWFGEDEVSSFDSLVLRAHYNYSWTRGNRGGSQTGKDYTMLNDRWAAETQEEMGGLSTNGTYVHLYVNGLYWGVYNPNERIDSTFISEHLGGDKEEYDVVAHDGLVDGNLDAWNEMIAVTRERPFDYEKMKQHLDVSNFIDYMILNQYGGNLDWPQNNWYASRRRADGEKWQFHSWDAEFFFIGLNDDRVLSMPREGPGIPMVALQRDPEFRIDFADRVYEHLFNDGLLTAEANIARLDRLAAPIDRAVVGESARWGDAWMNQVEPPRTRDDDWLPRLEELRTEYFPRRGDILISRYIRRRLYPETPPPQFSHETGPLPVENQITITSELQAGQIYYTTDGSDPRLTGGLPNPNAQIGSNISLTVNAPLEVRARVFHDDEWSALAVAEFFDIGDVNHDGAIDVRDIDLLCQEIRSNDGDHLNSDLNRDDSTNQDDLAFLIKDILKTTAGDADLDGTFDSVDLVKIFQAGQYDDGLAGNSTWATGDWNCDGEFDSGDLVAAFQAGGYQ